MLTDKPNIKDLEAENRRLREEVERLRGELHEQNSEAFITQILQNAHDSIIMTDQDLVITHWNKGAERIYGWLAEEVIGKKTTELTHTEYPEIARDDLKQLLDKEGVWEGEAIDRNKKGDIIITHLSALRLLDSEGNLQGYATINRDITVQKQLEKDLQESHDRFTLLSVNSRDLYCLHHVDGTFEWVSESSRTILGFSPEELLSKSPYDFIHPEDQEIARQEAHLPPLQVRPGEEPKVDRSIFRFRTKSGKYIILEVITIPIFGDNGEVSQILSSSRDVTQRMEAEEALVESRQRIRMITDAMPFCIAYIDKALKYQFTSRQYEEWFGLGPEELIGKDIHKLTELSRLSGLDEGIKKVLLGNEVTFEGRTKDVDGEYFDVQVRFIPDSDENSSVRGFFSVIEDISERKKTESELRDLAKFPSENRGPILRISNRGEILYHNEAAERMLKKWDKFKDKKPNIELLDVIHNSIRNKRSQDIEARYDGQSYNLTVTPIEGESYVNIYASNITRQKRAEAALMNRVEYERLLVDITSKLINLRAGDIDQGIDYALREVGQHVDANNAFVYAIDFDSGYATCTHHWSSDNKPTGGPKGKKYPIARLAPWFERKLKQSFIFNIHRPSDLPAQAVQERELLKRAGISSVCVVPLVREDEVIGFAGFDSKELRPDWSNTTINLLKVIAEVFINALQNQEYEKALKGAQSTLEYLVEQRTAELKRSNRDLEKFAYLASHDLQEPLRMIISYLQILERRIKDDLDKDELEFLNFSVDGAKRMKGLLDAILQYSRINRFKQPFTEVSLAEPIEAALQNLQISIKSSKAEVLVENMPRIKADPIQMVQLFQNLIGNAIKFVEGRQPVVRIKAEVTDEDEVLISVSDNGIGIEERYKERIFDIFQRLHPKNQYEGSGIGLAICKTIVDRHGGRIWLESEVGEGTTFLFTLRRNPGYVREDQTSSE